MKEIQEWLKQVQPNKSNDPEIIKIHDDVRSRLEHILEQPEVDLRVVDMVEAIPTYGLATQYDLKASVMDALHDALVLISVTFYCKVCKRKRTQAVRTESRTGFMPCHWCNDYWIYLVPIVTGGKPGEVKERFRHRR